MFRRVIGRLSTWIADRWALRGTRIKLSRAQLADIAATKKRRTEALADPARSPLERLTFWWSEPTATGLSDARITALEQRFSVRIPDDFRAYLKATMPQGNEWDAEGTRWFPLDDIKSVREECADWDTNSPLDSARLLVFADFLIWCYAWAIDCSDGANRGKVAIISGYDHYVADSFDEFLDRYLRDDPGLHA